MGKLKGIKRKKRMMNLGMGAVMALPVIVAVAPMQAEASLTDDKGTFAEISQKESTNFKVKNIENSLVSVGKDMMMAVSDKGKVSAWGDNSNGAYGSNLGANGHYINETPKESSDISDVQGVKTNGDVSFVLKKDGSLWGTGSSEFEFLPSEPTEENQYVPIKGITEEVVKVDMSTKWAVALTLSGKVYVWGNDNSTPKLIDSVRNIEDISVSDKSIGVLHEDGTISVMKPQPEGGKTSFDGVKPEKIPQLVNMHALDLAQDSNDMITLTATGNVIMVDTETMQTTPLNLSDSFSYDNDFTSVIAGPKGRHFLLNNEGNLFYIEDYRFNTFFDEDWGIYSDIFDNNDVNSVVSNIAYMDAGFGAYAVVTKTGEIYTWAEGWEEKYESEMPNYVFGRDGYIYYTEGVKGNYSTNHINEATKKNFAPFISDHSSLTVGYKGEKSLEFSLMGSLYDANVDDYATIHYSVDGEESTLDGVFDTGRKTFVGYDTTLQVPKVVGEHEFKIWTVDKGGLKSKVKTITYNIPEGSLDTPRKYYFPRLGVDFAFDNVISNGDYKTYSSLDEGKQEVAPKGSLVMSILGVTGHNGLVDWKETKKVALKYSIDGVEYLAGYTNAEKYDNNIGHQLIIPKSTGSDKPKDVTFWLVDEDGHESSKTILNIDYNTDNYSDGEDYSTETFSANYKIPEVTGGSVGTDLENFKQTGDLGFKVEVK